MELLYEDKFCVLGFFKGSYREQTLEYFHSP